MARQTYYTVLNAAMKEVGTVACSDKVVLEQEIAAVTDSLREPMSNLDRIELCAHRAALRKTLATLTA